MNTEKTQAKKRGGKTFLNFIISHCYLFTVLLSLFLFKTSLDLKIYDLFLYMVPSLKENDKVWVLTLDDDSMERAGGFPFRREVMADIIILLKELGTASITFDLSYLDESPNRLDPDYASAVFSQYLDEGFGEINMTAEMVIDGFAAGAISSADSEIYKEEFIKLNNRVRYTLEDSIAFLTRDVDEYFSQALRLTNNSYLTLTMIGRDQIIGDGELPPLSAAERIELDRVALDDIIINKDKKTPEMISVMPAIPKLLQNAKSAGTVNAGPDADGVRRRIHLLMKLDNKYYGNLALVGMSEIMGNPEISVSNKTVTLKNDEKEINIPRTKDGSILLKWPKKSFYDYNQDTLVGYIQHTIVEQYLADNIYVMDSSGFFSYYEGVNPWNLYAEAENLKHDLLDNYSDAVSEQWLETRKAFFESAESYLTGSYEDELLSIVAGDAELEDFVMEIFEACRNQLFLLLEIRQKAEYLKGAFCVIGSDATSMTDNGTTVFEEDYPNVGTYAVVANMLLSGEFLSEAPFYISIIIALIFSFFIAFIVNHLSSGNSLLAGFGVIILLAGLLYSYFALTKQYIPSAVPLVSTMFTFVLITVTKFLTANREKAFLHSAFSRYLSPQVINEIIADPSRLNLGGEKREMTAIFTDIQGFSTISEQLDPTHLVSLLNKYLTAMSNIVMENIGTVDKYEGDAIIAFFGAPLPRMDHAVLACRSALAMKKTEKELNKVIMEENLSPVPLFTRIGINTGDMVVGNMGAENKMDYTIMGNAVNLAARLEGTNKKYHTGGIIISEYTYAQTNNEFICRKLDRVRVVGINTPVRLYELLHNKDEASNEELERVKIWDNAIDLLENRKFTEAAQIFNQLKQKYPDDKTAGMYAARCETLIKSPPDNDWDGVTNLTEK